MKKKKSIRTLDRKQGLYLQHVGTKGRGVFCKNDIRTGEILEITPAVILNEKATGIVDRTMLVNYTFQIGGISSALKKKKGIRKMEDASAVIMGIATFCNHADVPNAEILWEEIEGTVYYQLRATRRIPKNTEICTSYGAGWFEEQGRPKKRAH